MHLLVIIKPVGLNYTLLAGLLLYAFVMRAFAHGKLGIVSASTIVVLGNFALATIVKAILLSPYNVPLSQLVGLVPIITVITQLLVAVFIFRMMQEKEESYSAWFLWGVVGGVGIFFIAPFVVGALFARF